MTVSHEALLIVIQAFLKQNGIIKDNLEGFNELMDTGIRNIIVNHFNNKSTVVPKDTSLISSYEVHITFGNIVINSPKRIRPTGEETPLFPAEARRCSLTYNGKLSGTVTIKITPNNTKYEPMTVVIHKASFGYIPIMIGSNKCHTYGVDAKARRSIGECDYIKGGYFIIKGAEISIDALENIKSNVPHMYINTKHDEYVRCEYLSHPGTSYENSSMLRIRYRMKSKAITIELVSTKIKEGLEIPYYVVYRMFNMIDNDFIENTIIHVDNENDGCYVKEMREILYRANVAGKHVFEDAMTSDEETFSKMIAEHIYRHRSDKRSTYNDMSKANVFDTALLPNIGTTTESRIDKLRTLGMLIRYVLLTALGAIEPTNRDSYSNKNCHNVTLSLPKVFKTHFNSNILQGIKSSVHNILENNQWSAVNSETIINNVTQGIKSTDFTTTLARVIQLGSSNSLQIKNRIIKNRLFSKLIESKSIGYKAVCIDSGIAANSESNVLTTRAMDMRGIDPSFLGNICFMQSHDTGTKVGMMKGKAVMAFITLSSDFIMLINKLVKDPDLIVLNNLSNSKLEKENLAKVLVNGKWIGAVKDGSGAGIAAFLNKYRGLRRKQEINKYITIYHDMSIKNEINFRTNSGRMCRPILIVDTITTPKGEFKQTLRLTPAHISKLRDFINDNGNYNFENLINEQVMEYICPEEAENCYIAESIDKLGKDPLKHYTHCEIPAATLSYITLLSPFISHSQAARITYSTNQHRQAAGIYSTVHYMNFDKLRWHSDYLEYPIITTLIYRFIPPTSANVIVGYTTSDNMEDSIVISESAVTRGMFSGAFFRVEQVELEKDEQIMTPVQKITSHFKKNANYEKLVDGIVPIGTEVVYGDVVIGRVVNKQKDGMLYVDKSVVYTYDESAVVVDVFYDRGGDPEKWIARVKLLSHRPITIGDKFASRGGNKGVTGTIVKDYEMPYTKDGLRPHILINPHSFPTRMIIAELIEVIYSTWYASHGIVKDQTAFIPTDVRSIMQRLPEIGIRTTGLQQVYDGVTGMYKEQDELIGLRAHNRLQKFGEEGLQVTGHSCPIDPIMNQPISSGKSKGGLRYGEMETHVHGSHGAMFTLMDFLRNHSDGRELPVCRRCGHIAVVNKAENIYICKECKDMIDYEMIDCTTSANVMYQTMQASGVNVRFHLEKRQFEQKID